MTEGFAGFGVIQRIYIGTTLLWMLLVATRLFFMARGSKFIKTSA